MELRDLNYFLHAAQSLHVGRAAQELGLTQPALTKSIARLERELNSRLFERNARGLVLTGAGSNLMRHALQLRTAVNDVKREFEDESSGGNRGHLRIGTGVAMSQYLLPLACTRLLTGHPQLTFDISSGTGRTLIPALRDYQLDLVLSGIEARPQTGLAQEQIMRDKVVVIARREHPVHRQGNVSLPQMVRERWVMSKAGSLISEWLARRCQELAVPLPIPAVRTDSVATLLSMVAGSDLLTFHSWSSIRHSPFRESLRPVATSKLVWRRRVGVTYRGNGYLPEAARNLIRILKELGAEDSA